tara:strand:- start:1262 stop:1429 length:168 start_codon:yes stop_codon:yes gene_type:complete
MTAGYGIALGIIGTLLTILGFGIAFAVASRKKKEIDKSSPTYQFWKDFPGHKGDE